MAPLTTVAMVSAPAEHAGVASAVNNDVARIGGLVAVAILPVVSGHHRGQLPPSPGLLGRLPDGGGHLRAWPPPPAGSWPPSSSGSPRTCRVSPAVAGRRPAVPAAKPAVPASFCGLDAPPLAAVAGRHDAGRPRRDNGGMTTETTTPTGTLPAGTFRSMDESTAEQWAVIGTETFAHQGRVADQVLAMLEGLSSITDGFAVDQLTHSLQTATRAEEAGADPEMVVASLCHDIGKFVSVPNHPRIAAEILRPYVRDEIVQVILAHQDFQGRHYYHHFGGDPDARDQYADEPWFALAATFADEFDQNSFDPDYPTKPLSHFEPLVRTVFATPQVTLMASAVLAPFTRAHAREKRRRDDMRDYVMGLARADFRRRHPDAVFAPVLVLIAAYLEADNIGDVLKAVPTEVDGLAVSTLVVVDGGDDGTEDIVAAHGAYCAVFPVNLGHGVALRLGYELADTLGASYVVTLDADGQNDPTEIPDLLAPVLADEADFVIASPSPGRGRDERRRPPGRRRLLRRRHQLPDRPAPLRHLERVPGPQDRRAP